MANSSGSFLPEIDPWVQYERDHQAWLKRMKKIEDEMERLANSTHEVRLRMEARRMGCSFWTRAKIQDPAFQPSSSAPWSGLKHKKLKRTYRRLCDQIAASKRPPRRQRDNKETLISILGLTGHSSDPK